MTPAWVKPKWRQSWREPWTVPPSRFRRIGFKRALRKHGYLAPHYTLREAACKDAARTPVPRRRRRAAQRHAFLLEQARHRLGDRPLPVLSWYRTVAHNRAVGGARSSKHLRAIATDFEQHVADQFGGRWNLVIDDLFNGIGISGRTGDIVHGDSRAFPATWYY